MKSALVIAGPFLGCLVLPVRRSEGGIFALILDGDWRMKWALVGEDEVREIRGKA